MTQATELRELASLIHVDGSDSYVGVSSTAFTPTDAFVVKDDGARITVESATREVAMLGRRGSSGVALESGYLRLRNQGVTANGVVLDSDANSWINGGNLGLGTSSPSHARLQVHENTSVTYDDTAYQHELFIEKRNNSGDNEYTGMRFAVTGHDGSTTAEASIGIVQLDNHHAGELVFGTRNSSGVRAEKMRITSGGNVGIGNDDPSTRLHVKSSSYPYVRITNDGYTGFDIGQADAGEGGAALVKLRDAADMDFYTADLNRMRISSIGNVGIGLITTDPSHKLDVNGAIATRQVRHSIAPTLNLDFANSKQLDPRITFYRNSVATYYDSKGIVRYVNENEPRFDHDPATGESKGLLIEELRKNHALLSDNIVNNSTWTISGSSTLIEPNAGVAPDGTYSASRIKFGSSSHVVAQNVGAGISVGNTVTTSMWVKGTSGETLRFASGGTDFGNETLTGEWQRVVGTRTAINTTVNINTYGGATARDVLVWGVQCELGPFVTSYIPSETRFNSRTSKARYHDKDGILKAANRNTPRYGYKYDGKKWVETGLILETAATNMITNNTGYNDRYNVAGMQTASLRLIKDNNSETTIAPDGSTVSVFVGTGVSGGSYVYANNAVLSGNVYTYSVYVRRPTTLNGNNVRSFSIYTHIGRFPSYDYLVWDFDTDAFAKVPTAAHIGNYGYELLNNGWVRLYMTATTNSSGGPFHFVTYFSDETSNGTSIPATDDISAGVRQGYFWGAQIENAKAPSSYIPTYGSAVTRSADVVDTAAYTRQSDQVDMIDYNLTSWYNPDEGSFYTEHDSIEGNTNHWVWSLNDERTQYNHIDQLRGRLRVSPDVNNLADINGGVTLVSGTFSKIASRIKKDDFAISMDGNTVVTDTSVDHERNSTLLKIGARADGQGYLNGTLKSFRYYNNPLSDAELQALTENN